MSNRSFDFTKHSGSFVSSGELSGLLGVNLHTQTAGGTSSLPLEQLQAFSSHTYSVTDDAEMQALTQSIQDNGILTPLYVRPHGSGYEIISGHRRAYAAGKAGLRTVPCIIENMDDDTAAVRMVETNRYRERILPSERAFSYKLAADALNRQGRRSDLYQTEPGQPKLEEITVEILRSVRNWIRLTKLNPELLEQVDIGTVPVRAGVELSYLPNSEQQVVVQYIHETGKKLSISQAEALRSLSAELISGHYDAMTLADVYRELSVEVLTETPYIKFKKKQLQQMGEYIPSEYRSSDPAAYIIKALQYYRNQQNNQNSEL